MTCKGSLVGLGRVQLCLDDAIYALRVVLHISDHEAQFSQQAEGVVAKIEKNRRSIDHVTFFQPLMANTPLAIDRLR